MIRYVHVRYANCPRCFVRREDADNVAEFDAPNVPYGEEPHRVWSHECRADETSPTGRNKPRIQELLRLYNERQGEQITLDVDYAELERRVLRALETCKEHGIVIDPRVLELLK